jgi:hypothetical protein
MGFVEATSVADTTGEALVCIIVIGIPQMYIQTQLDKRERRESVRAESKSISFSFSIFRG